MGKRERKKKEEIGANGSEDVTIGIETVTEK